MKQHYYRFTVAIFLSIFSGINLQAQPLVPFPSPGLIQTEVYYQDWTQMFQVRNNSFMHTGDTVVGLYNYARFSYVPIGSSNPWYTCYDSGRVYFTANSPISNPAQGTLLYDFSLAVGDTFVANSFLHNGNYIVETVSTVTILNAQSRKYMELVNGTDTLRWIDGLGDIEHGFFYSSDFEGGYEELVCIEDSVGPLYSVPNSTFYCNPNDPTPNSGPNSCAPFNYNVQIYGTSCWGCDGAILLSNITGGMGGYTFQWSNGATTQNVYNLCAGPITLTITDMMGDSCARTFYMGIGQITVNLTHGSTNCEFSDTLCISPLGGNPPYVYSWSTGETTPCTIVTANGTYTVIVTDGNGCSATQTVTINNPQPLNVVEAPAAPTCSTCCDGNIALNVTGGIPPYAINGFPFWPSPNTFCSGWYTYCVTDSLDCQYCDSVYLAGPLGIVESDISRFKVFPNPAGNNVSIRSDHSGLLLVITDINGKILKEEILQSTLTNLDVSSLAEGCYFIRVGDVYERLVICR